MFSRLRTTLTLLLLGVALGWPVSAQAPTSVIDVALLRISDLYLDRAHLDAGVLFGAAGRKLEAEIEWLLVDVNGAQVVLRRGGGEVMGTVAVGGMDDLGRALRELSRLVRAAQPEPELLATLDGVDPDIVMLKGLTEALDRHSRVLYGEKLTAFDKRLKGTFYGIGVRVELNARGELVITDVLPGNPAADAGLHPDDRILRIDGVSTVGMSVRDATERIGGPKGTRLELLVARPTASGVEELALAMERDEIREPNVVYEVLDGGFGYIRIDHFSELTENYLSEALIALEEAGALQRGLVIDLRNNTGGSMIQSARAADAFLTAGDLVHTVGPDGDAVAGLAERLWASDDNTEPEVPIVVLQNQRTASGAEILGGALRELDRAVLLGDRSYGKGTVQKVYNLDAATRLKLTVARYLLSGDISIDEVGIPADVPVGEMRFDGDGVRIVQPEVGFNDPAPLLFVHEDVGWRDGDRVPEPRQDMLLGLALRVLARARGIDRPAMLLTTGEVRELVRAEEEQRMVEVFAARGIDWSAAETVGPSPTVEVQVYAKEPPEAGQPATLVARVTNRGRSPLHRVMVRLASDDPTWDGMAIPVGRVNTDATVEGTAIVRTPIAGASRESTVAAMLDADGRPSVAAGTTLLPFDGADKPKLRLSVRLKPKGAAHVAEIELRNLSDVVLKDLRVRFEYPESAGIELSEYDTGVAQLRPEAPTPVSLGLDLRNAAEGALPLHVFVEAERYGTLADWSFYLPRDGAPVALEPPTIRLANPALSAPHGTRSLELNVADDRGVDHLVVWAGDDKLAYYHGNGRALNVSVAVPVAVGRNRYIVEAIDNQGIRTVEAIYLRGLGDEAPVADDSPN